MEKFAPFSNKPKNFIITTRHISCYPTINTTNYYIVCITTTGETIKLKHYGKLDIDLCRNCPFKVTIGDQCTPVYERYGHSNIKTYYLKSIVEHHDSRNSNDVTYGLPSRQPSQNSLPINNDQYTRTYDCH